MARRREFDDNKAMVSVEDLFWQKGYEGTSYQDLTAATGLGKGSLYAAFGNKKALYLRALDSYILREVEHYGATLVEKHHSAPAAWRGRISEFLNLAISAVADRRDRRGCFLCNAAVDLAPFDHDVEAAVLAAFAKIRAALLTVLSEPCPDPEARVAAAEHVLAVYFGLRVMAKAGVPVADLGGARDRALATLIPVSQESV